MAEYLREKLSLCEWEIAICSKIVAVAFCRLTYIANQQGHDLQEKDSRLRKNAKTVKSFLKHKFCCIQYVFSIVFLEEKQMLACDLPQFCSYSLTYAPAVEWIAS